MPEPLPDDGLPDEPLPPPEESMENPPGEPVMPDEPEDSLGLASSFAQLKKRNIRRNAERRFVDFFIVCRF